MQQPKPPRDRAEDLIRLLVPDWRPTPQQGLWAIRITIVLVVLVAIGYYYDITLWDWAKLLIIPAAIAFGGLWFTAQQRDREQNLAREHAQDEALQAYLDQMGQLLLDKERPLRQSEEHSEERTLARARTLTLLQRLDPRHKSSVLQFLSESFLIEAPPAPRWGAPDAPWARTKSPPIISLDKADLEHVDLRGMYLGIIDLSKAILNHADMTRCRFGYVLVMNANLGVPRLESTELSFAMLCKAHFGGAIMQGAILRHADLTGAGLGGADLTKADLTGADLTDADSPGTNFTEAIVTEEQLLACRRLDNATMPNGQKYEEWLKWRRGNKQKGNGSSKKS